MSSLLPSPSHSMTLPKPWSSHVSRSTGKRYIWNSVTNERLYNVNGLDPCWGFLWVGPAGNQKKMYKNVITNVQTYDFPNNVGTFGNQKPIQRLQPQPSSSSSSLNNNNNTFGARSNNNNNNNNNTFKTSTKLFTKIFVRNKCFV